jgi:hypothetical protein
MKKDLNIAEIKKEISRLEIEAQRLRKMAMQDIMRKSKGQPIKKNIGGKIGDFGSGVSMKGSTINYGD